MTLQSPTSEVIDGLTGGVGPALALLAGMQLDVFTALSDGPKATDELAVVLSVGSFRLTPLLYALVAAGLLIVERDRFSNTAETNKFLVNGLPDYRGHTQTASEESTVGRRWTSIQCR